MINKWTILGFIFSALILATAVFNRLEGRKEERAICQAEKLEEVKIINNNNEKIINENVEVIKRERQNRIVSVSDDLKWLRENAVSN